MNLDRKGFAITGILYTIFILFLLVMAAVLASLQSRKNILEKSFLRLEDSFSCIQVSSDDEENNSVLEQIKKNKRALVTGKYTFKLVDEMEDVTCIAYLKNGDTFEGTEFLCDNYDFSFDENEDSVNRLVLDSVCYFKG